MLRRRVGSALPSHESASLVATARRDARGFSQGGPVPLAISGEIQIAFRRADGSVAVIEPVVR